VVSQTDVTLARSLARSLPSPHQPFDLGAVEAKKASLMLRQSSSPSPASDDAPSASAHGADGNGNAADGEGQWIMRVMVMMLPLVVLLAVMLLLLVLTILVLLRLLRANDVPDAGTYSLRAARALRNAFAPTSRRDRSHLGCVVDTRPGAAARTAVGWHLSPAARSRIQDPERGLDEHARRIRERATLARRRFSSARARIARRPDPFRRHAAMWIPSNASSYKTNSAAARGRG
jgi:hypothetical protein